MKRWSFLALAFSLTACQPQSDTDAPLEPEIQVADNAAQIELPPASQKLPVTQDPKTLSVEIKDSKIQAFGSYSACVSAKYSSEECRIALSTAQAMHDQQPPIAGSLQQCQTIFSSCIPVKMPVAHQLFAPQMVGFSVGEAHSANVPSGFYAPVYHTAKRDVVSVIERPNQGFSLLKATFSP
jgi:uncharacterized protein YgiB involved in biofilm formation